MSLFTEPRGENEPAVVVKDANGERPEQWLAVHESKAGDSLACVAATGYVAFYRRMPHPFVDVEAGKREAAVTFAPDGHVLLLGWNGILSRTPGREASPSATIRGGELVRVASASMRLSSDGQRLVLCYCGEGPGGEFDHRSGIEVRDAATFRLLLEIKDRAISSSEDLVKDLAWIGGNREEVGFATNNVDSEYVVLHRESMRSAVWSTTRQGRPITTAEFRGLTLDGRYWIVSCDNPVEVDLVPTHQPDAPGLGPFRFPGQSGAERTFARLLRHAYDLKPGQRGVEGRLGADHTISLIAEPTGAQMVVDGRRVAGIADLQPAQWSPSCRRWLGLSDWRTRGGEFGSDSLAYLLDSATGYVIGEFPVPTSDAKDIGFLHSDADVFGFGWSATARVATSLQLKSPPAWFEHMGAAITCLQLGDDNVPLTLTATAHETARRAFLQDLRDAAAGHDAVAERLLRYFEEPDRR